MSSLEATFKQYQAKFPLYSKDAIINEMVKDGVFDKMLNTGDISQTDIERIKKGGSLFLLGNLVKSTATEFNTTAILGGDFSTKKSQSETNPSHTPKLHEFTSLVEVDSNGKIFNSQFSIEGIRKKFDENKYKVTKEVDKQYPNCSTITIIDRKTNKIFLKYEIYTTDAYTQKSSDIMITHYDKQGKKADEFVIIHEYGSDCYIGKVSKGNDKYGIDTFYEKNGNIQKTYEYSLQK